MAKLKDKLATKMPTIGAPKDPKVWVKVPKEPGEGVSKEQQIANWKAKFAKGKEFHDGIVAGATTITAPTGEKFKVACVPLKDLNAYLSAAGTPASVQTASKRLLAYNGIVTDRRAIRYNKTSDEICFFPDKMEKAPGANIQTRVVHAKGAAQGERKFGSLIDRFNKLEMPVDVTEAQVIEWLRKTGRSTGKLRPRKAGAAKPTPVAKPKKKK